MSFISIEFIVFCCVTLPLYFLLKQPLRWVLLVITSYLFYIIGNGNYVIILVFSTVTDYVIALQLNRTQTPLIRKLLLSTSLFLNLSVLFVFKYFDFFSTALGDGFRLVGMDYVAPTLHLVLPIGISFYTFQALAYTIDVYRGKLQPEHNLGIFATFIVFFPQLVAGPIERASDLLPQIKKQLIFNESLAVSGLRLILWGVFKKVVIADRLAIYVDTVYSNPHEFSGQFLIVATVFFAFQIYCDFSGYSDIAIGVARIMGIKLTQNFRQPYFSQSIREFWRRWHITLSNWFRDYVYIPLGGNRVSVGRNVINLMIVFVLSGLWHGASWTFVFWGAIHGLVVVLELVTTNLKLGFVDHIPHYVQTGWRIIVTFMIVCVAWVFFRANNIDDALYIITHFHQIDPTTFSQIGDGFQRNDGIIDILRPLNFVNYSYTLLQFILSVGLIGLLMVVDFVQLQVGISTLLYRMPPILRWTIYNVMVLTIVLFGHWGNQSFIYFQF